MSRLDSAKCGTDHTINIPPGSLPADATFALDIGGSLAKIACIPHGYKRKDRPCLVHLKIFDTDNLDACLDYVTREVIGPSDHVTRRIYATGTGCVKYQKTIADRLSVQLHVNSNEMECMAKGLDTLWRILPSDQLLYPVSKVTKWGFRCSLLKSGLLPCLLVNLGSAMTIVEIDAQGACSGVIGGSSQGGLTFLGLGCLLTKAQTVAELVRLAERGDRTQIDLRVKDTTGADHYAMTGSDDMVSSFGKAARSMTSPSGTTTAFSSQDLAHSVLYSVTDQLAQTAYLVAKAQRVNNVVFCGSYLTLTPLIKQEIIAKLDRCVKYLQHEVCPIFVKHEGHLGCIGLLFDPSLAQQKQDI